MGNVISYNNHRHITQNLHGIAGGGFLCSLQSKRLVRIFAVFAAKKLLNVDEFIESQQFN